VSRTFSPKSREYFRLFLFTTTVLVVLLVAGTWYYVTPAWTRPGYRPVQPVRFSHAQHAGQLGLDCTYCHNHVGEAPHANVPSAQVCMNCHAQNRGNIKALSPALEPLRDAYENDRPVPWERVHKVPDFAYFNHAVHVRRGVSCVECHGKINEMEVVRHVEPLTMSWCLECHRNPREKLRPAGQVTNLDWKPEDDPLFAEGGHEEFLDYLMNEVGIEPPHNCSGCHR